MNIRKTKQVIASMNNFDYFMHLYMENMDLTKYGNLFDTMQNENHSCSLMSRRSGKTTTSKENL